MFRFETCVRVLFATLAITFSLVASATDDAAKSDSSAERNCSVPENEYNTARKAYEDAEDTGKAPDIVAKLKVRADERKAEVEKCYGTNSNNPADCGQAKGKYSTAKGALASACLTLGGGNTGTSEGWPLCTLAINQCDACPAAGDPSNENIKCDGIEVNEEENADRQVNNAAFGLRDVNVGKQLLKYCPGKLGADQKDLEKQMQESQKEVRRLEGELPKLQQEYTEIQAETENQVSEIQDQMVEAQNQLDEQMEKAQNSQDEAIKALQEKITGIEEQIARADDNIRQIQISKTDAENTYGEAIKQIDLNCHASATQTVSKYQQDRLQLERAKQFNRVSFNNVMKQVGVSDRQSWQRVAEKYYQWCLQSKPTKDSKDSARKIYDSALAKADEAIAKITRDKARLRDAIKKVQSDQGCNPQATGPQNGETDMCRAMRMAKQSAERLMRQYNSKMNQFNRKMGEAQRKGAAKAQAKLAEANLIQNQLSEERTRLNNLKQYLELAYQAGGGGTAADAKSYTDAKSKYGDFVAAASVFVSCLKKDDCLNLDTACKEASVFLDNIQAHPGFADAIAKTVNATPGASCETSLGKPGKYDADGWCVENSESATPRGTD